MATPVALWAAPRINPIRDLRDRKAAVSKAVEKGFYKANAAITPEVLEETIGMLSYAPDAGPIQVGAPSWR